MWSGHGAVKLIFFLPEDGKGAMQDKPRSHVFRHPPPYLGITCSRFGASVINAQQIEHAVIGGTTDEKTQPVNVMEVFYSLIRKQAWTAFHPPPPI